VIRLGVNVDHVATVRNARGGREPDPVTAAHEAELGGADQITVHLREDRRHIRDRDLRLLRETVQTPLNLELALEEEVLAIALEVKPDQVTFVPERREEVTTEGGLDVAGQVVRIREAAARFHAAGIGVSLFVDPDAAQLDATVEAGVKQIELHTGAFADASAASVDHELQRLKAASAHAIERGLHLAMGHGLNVRNVLLVRDTPGLEEVNIGHSIVSRAIYVGLRQAVREMRDLLA
jgi:pyridoxine 5-phosphate synthase